MMRCYVCSQHYDNIVSVDGTASGYTWYLEGKVTVYGVNNMVNHVVMRPTWWVLYLP